MMADIDGGGRAESFSSVYVLDSHYQYKDVGAVNIFSSPAGRELISSNQSPERRKSLTNKRTNHDITKFVLNPENLLINDSRGCMDYQINYTPFNSTVINNTDEVKLNGLDYDVHCGEENASKIFKSEDENFSTNRLDNEDQNGGVMRRIFNQQDEECSIQNRRPQLDKSHSLTDDKYNVIDKNQIEDSEMRIDRKILKYNSTRDLIKQNNFSGEKCDIFRKILSGFLSGWSTGSLTDITRWRKRKSSDELYREASLALGIPCELTDSCRCIECQCHYFDCGDEDSESSETTMNLMDSDNEDWLTEDYSTNPYSDVVFFENETNHEPSSPQLSTYKEYNMDNSKSSSVEMGNVCTPEPSDAANPAEASKNVINSDGGPTLEIAAGTPVILDHLLNIPMTCNLQ